MNIEPVRILLRLSKMVILQRLILKDLIFSFKFTHSSREKFDWRLRGIIWKDQEVQSEDSVIQERDAASPCAFSQSSIAS